MKKLSEYIPGGCHTYSKGNDCFPANAPDYLVKGDGAFVWDNKGKKYIDWSMGLRSVILGHAHPAVNMAVIEAIQNGTNFGRPCMLEYELAETMCNLIPCAEMVKFGKSGSDVTSAAVRLARAYTGRDIVLIAEENPFISQHDWFISTTATDGGILFDNNVKKYNYATIEDSEEDIERSYQWKNIAAIILDPATIDITKEKLQYLRDICYKHGIVFILDEIISGFRYGLKGVHGMFGVTPDLATFGKAFGNGFSVSALCGKRDIMKLGDREHGNVFLLSGTHNAETTGLAAAMATIQELQKHKYTDLYYGGSLLITSIEYCIKMHGLQELIYVNKERSCNPSMKFASLELKTLFDQEMIDRGVLMPYIAPSFSHRGKEIDETISAAGYALSVCKKAVDERDIKKYLIGGHVEKPVFRRKE